MRILVCESSEILLRAIEGKLKLDGHEVITALDGRAAYNIITNEKIDVMITDILVPFVSGLELTFYVRSKLRLDFPIIILSKIHNMDTIKQAYRLGADEYITKPFDPDWLEVRIKKAVMSKTMSANYVNADLVNKRYSLS